MTSFNRLRARQIALAIAGLTFLVIAILSLFIPRVVATAYGYSLDSVDAFNEFRAIFMGFWTGLAVLLLTAAKQADNTQLGNLGGWMILLQALGRLSSFLLDGVPSARFEFAFILELTLSLLILFFRPEPEVKHAGP